jgi:hypothetical protein
MGGYPPEDLLKISGRWEVVGTTRKEAKESGYGSRLQKLGVSFHLVSIKDLVE